MIFDGEPKRKGDPTIEKINNKVHLSYKDILLVPYDDETCKIASRSDPDISTELSPTCKLKIPIISAPMDTVTGVEMASAMHQAGGLGIYTRHISDKYEEAKQVAAVEEIRSQVGKNAPVAVAIGVKGDISKKIEMLCSHGANVICLDIANGNHVFMIDAIKEAVKFKDKYGLTIIAGNVATPKAALRLAKAGADSVRVGIGSGASCSTRRMTGMGVPQLTAVLSCAQVLRERGVKIIADGGIRFPGDGVKALWAGADAIMMGYTLAGHLESPLISDIPKGSEVGEAKRIYRGMSSRNVSGRYDIAPEGVSFTIPFKGSVQSTLIEYAAGIKSGLSYANAMNLDELRRNVYAIRVSTMSQEESDPVCG